MMARGRSARSAAPPVRLFVALDVPERIQAPIIDALASWRRSFPELRWVPPQNWHLTLMFMGATDPRWLGWVRERLSGVATGIRPFHMRLGGLGSFPSAERAGVIWAGLDEGEPEATALASKIQAALAPRFPAHGRGFRAHLTLARCDPPMTLPPRLAATPLQTPRFSPREAVLYRSHLGGRAPRYEPVERLPLGRGISA